MVGVSLSTPLTVVGSHGGTSHNSAKRSGPRHSAIFALLARWIMAHTTSVKVPHPSKQSSRPSISIRISMATRALSVGMFGTGWNSWLSKPSTCHKMLLNVTFTACDTVMNCLRALRMLAAVCTSSPGSSSQALRSIRATRRKGKRTLTPLQGSPISIGSTRACPLART